MKKAMNTRRYIYLAGLGLFLALATSGCSNDDESATVREEGLLIEGIALGMESAETTEEVTATRATVSGYSVNTDADPTHTTNLATSRSNWLLDFELYNGNTDGNKTPSESKYDAGSFTSGTYKSNKECWMGSNPSLLFPNYYKPKVTAELYLDDNKSIIAIDQSGSNGSALLNQDALRVEKAEMTPAHIPTVKLKHKHAMLDFVIAGIVKDNINTVTVTVDSDTYTPYEVPLNTSTDKREYMLILPEETSTNPVVNVTTNEGTEVGVIRYKQTVKVFEKGNITKTLGSNNCYCFTLIGKALDISPITITDWTRGESIQGEYIAVTAYPTFKAEGYANQTFYFYYDNKLKENGKAKLQEIKFNENAECTIKPDGRILTHIYKADEVEEISNGSINKTPKAGAAGKAANITLGQMVIKLTSSDLPN